jgi:hypothetical protein
MGKDLAKEVINLTKSGKATNNNGITSKNRGNLLTKNGKALAKIIY